MWAPKNSPKSLEKRCQIIKNRSKKQVNMERQLGIDEDPKSFKIIVFWYDLSPIFIASGIPNLSKSMKID